MKKYVLPISIVMAILFILTLWMYWHRAQKNNDLIIADDIAMLAGIFNKIHKECHIVSFEHQKNYIDFLNVIAFEGSEIGSMNLKYPQHWKGAYLKDNPTMQEQYYQVVRTHKGYFVVPGPGVRLANGKIIGKDILFDEDADIEALLKTELISNGRPLAAPIMVATGEQPSESFQEEMLKDRLRGM